MDENAPSSLLSGFNKDPIKSNECFKEYFERKYLGVQLVNIGGWGVSDGYFNGVQVLTEHDGTFPQVLDEMSQLIQSHQAHIRICVLCRDFTKAYEEYLKKQNPTPTWWQKICSFWQS